MKRFTLASLAVALLAACGNEPESTLPQHLVATFDGGEITMEELTEELLQMPPGRRPSGSALDEAWLEDFVKETVVDRLLDRQAELTGFEGDPRVLAARAEFERSEVWNTFVRQNLPAAAPPTEAALRAEFDRRRQEAPAQAERRLLHYIFLRRQPGEANDGLRQRALDLRNRHLSGEDFARLAEEYSDSESRDRRGNLGWLERSQLEPSVAEIVFDLGEGSTSEPALTAEGAHLFKVVSIERPVEPVFEDTRDALAREFVTAEQQRHVLELAGSLPEPDNAFFVASSEELVALARANDPTALVLRNGDYEVRLAALAERAAGTTPLMTVLEALALRERVYAEARRSGWIESPDIQRRTELATVLERRRLQRLDGMRLFLGRDEERLGAYFEANKARFSTPLTLELERLRVPAQGDEKALVLELGDRLRAAKSGRVDLAELANEFGGEVEALGWVAIDSLGDTALAGALIGLEPGQATLPRYVDGSVEMTVVRARREPETRSLTTSLEEVRDAYLAEFGQPLYSEWRADLLQSANVVTRVPGQEEVLAVLAPPVTPPQPGNP